MFDQLMDYFGAILAPNLSASRIDYNTQHVLMCAVEDCKQRLDNNAYVGWVLMDLTTALDALPHGLMLVRLQAYEITNTAYKFISDYLSSRSQRVKIGHSKSGWLKLKELFRKDQC